MSFTTPYVSVDGIPSTVSTVVEYTSQPVSSAYTQSLNAFMAVMENVPTSTNPFPAQAVTATNQTQVNAALTVLTNLVKYGMLINSNGNAIALTAQPTAAQFSGGYTRTYVTMAMAQDYSTLLKSLAAVGVNINASGTTVPSVTLTQLQQWRDLAVQVSAIGNIVQAGYLDGVSGSQTLQGMILVDYVQSGNEVITTQLNNLNTALQTTQNVLASLTSLQNMHNQVTVSNPLFNLTGALGNNYVDRTPAQAAASYVTAAQTFFNAPVSPILVSTLSYVPSNPSVGTHLSTGYINEVYEYDVNVAGTPAIVGTGLISALTGLLQTRNMLQSELKSLSTPSAISNPNSLYSRVAAVLNDINKNFSYVNAANSTVPITNLDQVSLGSAFKGFQAWLVDGNNVNTGTGVTNQGAIQQNLNYGITAAENLNTNQQGEVSNYMFIFQEFYQSASAALQAITQIVQKMAQNISA